MDLTKTDRIGELSAEIQKHKTVIDSVPGAKSVTFSWTDAQDNLHEMTVSKPGEAWQNSEMYESVCQAIGQVLTTRIAKCDAEIVSILLELCPPPPPPE